ncbi:MAG: hypothetical protein ACPH4J_04515, partial [Gammaproteobacteria bacterium]
MNKTTYNILRSKIFVLGFFAIFNLNAIADDLSIPLEHFSCKSNQANFSISPDGKHMLIGNMIKDNECDIERNYDKRVEDEMRNVGLILLNLDTQETKSISRGKGSDRINSISSFGWINNNRIWYVPRFDMG